MIIKSKRKGEVLYITLEDTINGIKYSKTYTCSFDEARTQFKEYLKTIQ